MGTKEVNPVMKCVAFSIPTTILLFVPGYFDPINLPKLLSLFPIVITTLVLIYSLRKSLPKVIQYRERLILYSLYLTLAVTMTISGFIGSDNVTRVLFGASGRNNGLLYYLFAITLVCSILNLKLTKVDLIYVNKSISFTSILFAFYCSVQFLGLDPMSWSNPYNKVIGTLGNPNFSSSALAIFAGFWLYRFVQLRGQNLASKVLTIVLALLMMFLSWSTGSLQGIVIVLLALTLVLYAWIRERHEFKYLPPLFLVGGSLSLLFIFSSFMGLGPLGNLLEQYTLRLRVWYALFGIRAMIDSPLVGVGVDNYISAFRTHKTAEFVSLYGSELSSNNAHSSPIQIGASFGLIVFILFCVTQMWVLVRAVTIINSRSSHLSILKGISIVWILVFAQSLLSIEIIGLGIMNWVLGAVILSSHLSSHQEQASVDRGKSRMLSNKVYPVWTGSLMFATLFLSSLIFIPVSIEDKAFQKVAFLKVDNTNSQESIKENYQKLSNLTLSYPNKIDLILTNLSLAGLSSEIEVIVRQINEKEDKDAQAVNLLASFYKNSGDIVSEIATREKLRVLDPWNMKLELALARSYEEVGDKASLVKSIERINFLRPDSPEYLEALALLQE